VANFFLLILISEGDQFCLQTDGTMNGEWIQGRKKSQFKLGWGKCYLVLICASRCLVGLHLLFCGRHDCDFFFQWKKKLTTFFFSSAPPKIKKA
jgi:hypothetical protein